MLGYLLEGLHLGGPQHGLLVFVFRSLGVLLLLASLLALDLTARVEREEQGERLAEEDGDGRDGGLATSRDSSRHTAKKGNPTSQ